MFVLVTMMSCLGLYILSSEKTKTTKYLKNIMAKMTKIIGKLFETTPFVFHIVIKWPAKVIHSLLIIQTSFPKSVFPSFSLYWMYHVHHNASRITLFIEQGAVPGLFFSVSLFALYLKINFVQFSKTKKNKFSLQVCAFSCIFWWVCHRFFHIFRLWSGDFNFGFVEED